MPNHGTRPALIVVTAALAWAGCESRPELVHFVLPDGWRGGFAIMPDDPDGVELKKTNGRYVIIIPASGVLRVKGHDPFGSFLNTGSFASGQPLWVSTRIDDRPKPGMVALWGVGTHVRYEDERPINTFWWFVGTEDEWQSAHDARYKPGAIMKKD